jgi:hypothetical protein
MLSFPTFTSGVKVLPERKGDRWYVPSATLLATIVPIALIVFGGWQQLPIALTIASVGALSSLTLKELFTNERQARAAGLSETTLELHGLSAIVPGALICLILAPIVAFTLLLGAISALMALIGALSPRR